MKTLFPVRTLFLFVFYIAFNQALSAQTWDMVLKLGGSGHDQSNGIVLDASGNIYTTGWFESSLTFGSTTINSSGLEDIYVAKYSSTGTPLWIAKAGGATTDYSYDIQLDAVGNTYITGLFTGTAVFGSYTLNCLGGTDIFIAKLDPLGNFLWAKRAGSSATGSDMGNALATDAVGNIFVIGVFEGTADFEAINVTSAGGPDVFIAKYNTAGNIIWVTTAGGAGLDYGTDIILDKNELFFTGSFAFTAAFGSTNLTTIGYGDIFIARADTAGNITMAAGAEAQNSGAYSDAFGIARDGSGNILVTGRLSGTADFGSNSLTSIGYEDLIVAKYNTSNTWEWIRQAGGSDADMSGERVAVDEDNNIYVTGFMMDTVDFSGTMINSDEFGYNVFVVKYTNTGTQVWVKAESGTSEEVYGRDLLVDTLTHKILVTGGVWGNADFDAISITGNSNDAYVARIDQGGTSGLQVFSSNQNSLNFYPNPAANSLTVINSATEGGYIKIYDAAGRELKIMNAQGEKTVVDIKDIAPGIYTIELISSEGPLNRGKLIKL